MTTDTGKAARLAALQARRSTPSKTRRRPAEASRILVAGAGISAMLSLVTVMARADLVASSPDGYASPVAVYGQAPSETAVAPGTVERVAVPATAQSVTVVRVARPQRAIGRSSGSR